MRMQQLVASTLKEEEVILKTNKKKTNKKCCTDHQGRIKNFKRAMPVYLFIPSILKIFEDSV